MDKSSRSTIELSLELLSSEARKRSANDPHEAVIVCEKLRTAVTRLAGADGFNALFRRAFSMTKNDFPVLADIEIGSDCSPKEIEGLNDHASREAAAAIVQNFISLLTTFMGEALTTRFLREIWPDELGAESENEKGGDERI